jgi:periplasmic divalent cation tolerance protein
MGAVVVVTTVGDEEQALLIAREMVARRLAACVNVLPGIRSVYRWQGKICQDGEYLLLIKTLAEEYEPVAAAIRELHSYELPEILAFPVEQGDARFFAWIRDSLDKSAAFDEDDGEDDDDAEADEDHEGDDRDLDGDLGVAVAPQDERGEP